MNCTQPGTLSTTGSLLSGPGLDLAAIRREFPILARQVHDKPLVYLDNAATTQKPRAVLDAMAGFYEWSCANVHRGVHTMSDRATTLYEQARLSVAGFIGAGSPREVVFVRGATEAINLAAHCFGRQNVGPGDEVIVTWMEHHANIVPWQILCAQTGASLRVVPISDAGELRLEAYEKLLSRRTKLVALGHVSNALGTVNPVQRVIDMAHQHGAAVVVDGAQAVAHVDVNVHDLDCDFYAFSGHKVFGPMGIGILYGKLRHLEAMPPWQAGSDMIETVTFEKTSYAPAPLKFEAGTPNIEGAIGLAEAVKYLEALGMSEVVSHEKALTKYAVERMQECKKITIHGCLDLSKKCGIIPFSVKGLSSHDVALICDNYGIMIRSGYHCAQPLHQQVLKLQSSDRASFYIYNTQEEIDRFVEVLKEIDQL